MLDATIPQPAPDGSSAPQRRSLLDAALRLAAVMRHAPLSFEATADRLESYDAQPYPLTYVLSSNHVVDFLRALEATRAARDDGQSVPEAQALGSRPSYGPVLREAR